MSPAIVAPETQVAAGAIVWRMFGEKLRVLLIHRDSHNDVSFPKGKVDPGEAPPQTAVREIAEETGLFVRLGVPLGTSEYPLPNGRPKVVHYWSAQARGKGSSLKGFTGNDEVDRIEWAGIDKAMRLLTYDRDKDVLRRFADAVATGSHRSFAIIALRHAQAVPREKFAGEDVDRPLSREGVKQAAAVAPTIAAWDIGTIITSPARRCRETVAAVAKATGLTPKVDAGISQAAWEAGESTVAATAMAVLEAAKGAVLCSHGPVLPDLLLEVARGAGGEVSRELQRAAALDLADFAVVHITGEGAARRIAAVEAYGPRSIAS